MATSIIQDLIAQAKARDGGRGPGRGGAGAGGNSWMGGGGQMNGSGGEVQFPVPADKCGLVIGKGEGYKDCFYILLVEYMPGKKFG